MAPPIDPTAVSATQAAWAAVSVAREQLVANWAGAAANTAVVAFVALLTFNESRRSRMDRLKAAHIAISHGLDQIKLLFDTLHETDGNLDLLAQPIGPAISHAKAVVDGAMARGIEDPELQILAQETATLLWNLQWSNEGIEKAQKPYLVRDFLVDYHHVEEAFIAAVATLRAFRAAKLRPGAWSRYRR